MNTIKAKHHGFVLITVLLIVALLSSLLLKFNYASRINVEVADSYTQRLQALNCARAGMNIALAAIRRNPDIRTNKTLRRLLLESSDYEVGAGSCLLEVVGENGKINVNMFRDKNGRNDRTRIDQMLRLIDVLNHHRGDNGQAISYAIVPALIDWSDPDDQVTHLQFVSFDNTGAESSCYETMLPPYRCTNQPLRTIAELGLVNGITPEILYGTPSTNIIVAPAGDKNGSSPLIRLTDHITVHGDGKIDINCASVPVIQSLSEKISPELAGLIVQRRRKKPFSSVTELQNFPAFPATAYSTIGKMLTIEPEERFYTVRAIGAMGQTRVTVTAVVGAKPNPQKTDVILYTEN